MFGYRWARYKDYGFEQTAATRNSLSRIQGLAEGFQRGNMPPRVPKTV
jgi:hypothetical protein